MIDNRVVGKTIATLRQNKGMTQQQLAAAMNVSHQAVSKWENGAALPDIQTLVELTQLFGVTVEQLLTGDIPQNGSEPETASDPLRDIGKFVSGVADSISGMFRTESANIECEENEQSAQEESENSSIDLRELLQMAPFMSKAAVGEMLLSNGKKLSSEEIAKFAPFVDAACLEKLIRRSDPEISWNTLKQLAPFLKREAVDGLAKAIAMGEKFVQKSGGGFEKAAGDVCKALDDVGKKLGQEVDKAVRKAVEVGESVFGEVGKAIDDLTREPETREERHARLRCAAFEKALAERKWDWIEAHADEICDDALREKIAEAARAQGMEEWVEQKLGWISDEKLVAQKIAAHDWEWIDENIDTLEQELQLAIVKAAAEQGKWDWIVEKTIEIDMSVCAPELVCWAKQAGRTDAVLAIVRYEMLTDQLETFLLECLGNDEFEFVDQLSDRIPAGMLPECCAALAKSGNWTSVERYAAGFTEDELDKMMEIAIESGNFDMIDMLEGLENDTKVEGE